MGVSKIKKMRLHKFLASAGVSSRRSAEKLIAQGRVMVNKKIIREMGFLINPVQDKVAFDHKLLHLPEKNYYVLLYKPASYLSSAKDLRGRPIVLDLIKGLPLRVFSVGRLDYDTEGVLLLTNDGELAYRLMHPRFLIEKKYEALVKGAPSASVIENLTRGIRLEDGTLTAPAKISLLETKKDRALLSITLHEGRKRQVKRMCRVVGHPLLKLKRTQFAFLTLNGLKPGQYRLLNTKEVYRLRSLVHLKT